MRRVILGLAFIALVGGAGVAFADVDNLSGGVYICHHDPTITYCVPMEGWCQHYLDGYAITTTEDQNAEIMTGEERIWYLISAWNEEKNWCGSEFGFGDYDPYLFLFTSYGPCTPAGNLEIPTDYWPGPLEGTAVTTTDAAWQGNFLPVYYFTGVAYQGTGQIPIDVDPPTGFVGWGNCLTPSVKYEPACLPAMGILAAGEECHLGAEPEWACCFEHGDSCRVITEAECDVAGGTWYEGETCDPNPCPIVWACCIDDVCYMMTEEECDDQGTPPWNTWFQGFTCDEIDCATPVEPSSWGRIKAIYR